MALASRAARVNGLVRIVVADDDPTVREALALLLGGDEAFEVVGSAADAEEAVRVVDELRPDVAVVDVRMPGGGGSRAVTGIRACSPRTRIVTFSAYEDTPIVAQMVRAGIDAYLVKGAKSEEILQTIHRVMTGQGTLAPEVAAGVIHELGERLEREELSDAIRRDVRDRLTRVMDGDGVSVVFQPIAHLGSGRIVGLEALARFDAADELPVDRWFSDAWEVGVGEALEMVCVGRAFQALPQLPPTAYISCNVSPATLLIPPLREALGEFPAPRVVIEITEHARVDDYVRLDDAMARLRERGVRIAVDDAGAGFASLRHILQLAPDIIKLDVSLTRSIDSDRARRAMASGLITFAAAMGTTIVAEGIETREELEALRALGVEYGQGYYLEPPSSPPFLGLVVPSVVA